MTTHVTRIVYVTRNSEITVVVKFQHQNIFERLLGKLSLVNLLVSKSGILGENTNSYYTVKGIVLTPAGGLKLKKPKDSNPTKKINKNITFINETGQFPITITDAFISYKINGVKRQSM